MREKLKKLPVPVTIILCIGLAALFIVTLKGGRFLVTLTGAAAYTYYLSQLISEILPLLLFSLIAFLFGYSFIWKENRSGWRESLYRGGFFTVYCASALCGGIILSFSDHTAYVKVWEMLVFTLSIVLVGVVEELVFRGVILNLLLDRFPKSRKGMVWAIALDGLFFGLMHFSNMLSGATFAGCLVQVVSAAFIGMLFSYIYLRTRNLKLVMLYHFMTDFASLLSSGLHVGGNLASSVNGLADFGGVKLLVAFAYLIPLLLLLRARNMDRVVDLENGLPSEDSPDQVLGISRVSMIMGIISVAMCFFAGYSLGFGILGLLACSLSKKKGLVNRMTKAGKILSIIGIVFGVLAVIGFSIFYAHIDMTAFSTYSP